MIDQETFTRALTATELLPEGVASAYGEAVEDFTNGIYGLTVIEEDGNFSLLLGKNNGVDVGINFSAKPGKEGVIVTVSGLEVPLPEMRLINIFVPNDGKGKPLPGQLEMHLLRGLTDLSVIVGFSYNQDRQLVTTVKGLGLETTNNFV